MTTTIDKAAAVVNARAWAEELRAWKGCSMVQLLMAKQIIGVTNRVVTPDEQYEALEKLLGDWRGHPKKTDIMFWMIEQLEMCLGLSGG